MGRHEEGLKDRTEAIRLKPDLAEAWLARGSAYYLLGRYEEAFSDLDQAAKLAPDNQEIQTVRAKAREEVNRKAAAQALERQKTLALLSGREQTRNSPSRPQPAVVVPSAEPAPLPKVEAPRKQDHKTAETHNKRGRELLQQKKYAEAIRGAKRGD